MKPRAVNVIARNGKVEMSRDDFLFLIRLAGAKVESIESIRVTTPATRGPEPGTNVNAKKKRGPKRKEV